MNCTDFDVDSATKPVVETHEETPQISEAHLKIGYVAKQYQVTLRTLRFYEDSGLLQPKRRGLTRLYSLKDCKRLEMILRGRQLGFSLAEINNLIRTRDDSVGVTDIEATLSAEQIKVQIDNLEHQRADLEKAISALRLAHHRMCELADHGPVD